MDARQPISIPPLRKISLPAVPWFLKCFGSLNNRWNESVVNLILQARDASAVMAAWKDAEPDEEVVASILGVLQREMGWKDSLFIPEDQVFIVLKLWWHGFADCWERERCLWELERILNLKLTSSVIANAENGTLGELLQLNHTE